MRYIYLAVLALLALGVVIALGNTSFFSRRTALAPLSSISPQLISPALSPTPTTTPTPALPSPSLAPSHKPIPRAIDHVVPFTSQAPYGVWDAFHEDTCEEAAVLMSAHYKNPDKMSALKPLSYVIPKAEAEEKLREIADWETKEFGYWKDTTAAETATILQKKYGIESEVTEDVSEHSIKQALADGHLVLIPTAGRLLGSPYYTPPGPAYHFILIRGFTADGMFITNDSGTKYGQAYKFPINKVLNAIHDWTGNYDTIQEGKKVMIIVE